MRNALVPLSPSNRDTAKSHNSRAANANFIAHLIATAAQEPQTRARRRATPVAATAAYRALGQGLAPAGRAVCRSL